MSAQQPDIAASAANLSRSLARLAQTTREYVHMRVDQADDAIAAEVRRRLWLQLSAGALLLWLSAGVMFAGLAIVMANQESNRVLAATVVAAAFFALAATAAWVLRLAWRQRPSALDWIAQLSVLIARFLRQRR